MTTSPASAHSPSTTKQIRDCRFVTLDEPCDRGVIGCCWAAITRHATSSTRARCIRRDERTPRDQQYNNSTTIIDGSYFARPWPSSR